MGTVCAPPYEIIFMNKIDKLIKQLAKNVSNKQHTSINQIHS